MNNKLNKINNNLKKLQRSKRRQVNNLKRRLNNKTRKIRNQVKIINRMHKKYRRNRMPAAITSSFKRQFSILYQTGTSMRVHGKDLIYKIPELISTNSGDVMTVIPCNPAYWTGTRISAIASGYQNYRPLQFKVTYVPQCAVTQQGNVLAGTLWAMTPNNNDLQQTLRTSNGGMLVQCYKAHTTNVKLGTNLQINLYRMGGKFDQESNPFIFIALAIGTYNQNENKINPGYFYVEYEYELKNPIGNTIKYYNSGLIKNKDSQVGYVNETLINCTSNNQINIGATIQKDNNKYYWHEKEINITEEMYVWYFSNDITDDNITLKLSMDADKEVTDININFAGKDTKYYYNDIGDNVGLLISVEHLLATNVDLETKFMTMQGSLYSLTSEEFNEIMHDYNFDYINTTENNTWRKIIYTTDINIELI